MPPSDRPETLAQWKERCFAAPARIAAEAVEQAKRDAVPESERVTRGGAYAALLLVGKLVFRVAKNVTTAPLASTIHSIDLAQSALTDVRAALVAAQKGGA